MEKLIELLNEFSPEDFNWCEIDGRIFDKSYEFGDTPVNFEMGVYIISKQFGFIEWLYNHKKMTLERLKISDLYWDINDWVGPVDNIIMHLSISEKPIELLISLLK